MPGGSETVAITFAFLLLLFLVIVGFGGGCGGRGIGGADISVRCVFILFFGQMVPA